MISGWSILVGAALVIHQVLAQTDVDGLPGTLAPGGSSTASDPSSSQMATTFEWDSVPKTLFTCSGLQDFTWKTTGETVEVEIVITNAGIDQTDPDLDGDNDASEFTSSNTNPFFFRRAIPTHLSQSDSDPGSTGTLTSSAHQPTDTPTNPVTVAISTNPVDTSEGNIFWNDVTVPPGFFYVLRAIFPNNTVVASDAIMVEQGSDTSCVITVSSSAPASPGSTGATGLPTTSTGGTGTPSSGSDLSAPPSKVNKGAVAGGIIGGLAVVAAIIAAIIFVRWSSPTSSSRSRRSAGGSGAARPRKFNNLASFDSSMGAGGAATGAAVGGFKGLSGYAERSHPQYAPRDRQASVASVTNVPGRVRAERHNSAGTTDSMAGLYQPPSRSFPASPSPYTTGGSIEEYDMDVGASNPYEEKYAMGNLAGSYEKSPFSDSGHNVVGRGEELSTISSSVGVIPIGYNPSVTTTTGAQDSHAGSKQNVRSSTASFGSSYMQNYSRPTSLGVPPSRKNVMGFSPSPQGFPETPDNMSDEDLAGSSSSASGSKSGSGDLVQPRPVAKSSPTPPTFIPAPINTNIPAAASAVQTPARRTPRKPVPQYNPDQVAGGAGNQSLPPKVQTQTPPPSRPGTRTDTVDSEMFTPLEPPRRPRLEHKSSTGSFTGREVGEDPESGRMMYALMPDPPMAPGN